MIAVADRSPPGITAPVEAGPGTRRCAMAPRAAPVSGLVPASLRSRNLGRGPG